ncbi:Muskelin N-terminus-domain-containing protein [Trametes punicea]|nr:Muskelin N-terminus-domain-containing protein [Trametes punicea]
MSGTEREPDVETVEYEIAGSSEHSGEYVADNILVDRPRDHSSRWSAAFAAPPMKQWIRLRLKKLCVLRSITFGKFYKAHPCNMKEFVVLVGMSEDNMTEVLRAGLKNDPMPETFSLRYTNRVGMPFPTRYVEILPLSAHGQNFNTSIWHISLSGITNEAYVEQVRFRHHEYRENLALRQVLKHLRQRRFLTPVNQILAQSGLQLEHPLVTSIHDSFVLNGDWTRTEALIRECSNAGLLRSYRQACQARTRWTRIRGLDADGDVPCRRGGHAMCMDEQNGVIYLFGGWDGQRNLDDFWAYDVAKDTWKLLSLATSREKNGPGPRACHKMVFDSKTGCIYLLGRLGDADMIDAHGTRVGVASSELLEGLVLRNGAVELRGESAHLLPVHCSEFHRYHTRGLDAGKWDLLAFDTAASGGPPLVSDHQMEIDSESQTIYVFGGRVGDAEWEALKFSGMYSYDIRTSRWKMYNITDAYASHPSIPPRFGHSMVLDTKSQTLFIFGGQREEKYLSDMFAFHVPTNTVTELFSNFSSVGGPDPCFTQRAVIDVETQEIYFFGGLTRPKPNAPPVVEFESPYWIYRYDRPDNPGQWSKLVPEKDLGSAWPQPRYAHQVVYDSRTKTVYMHGGNGGLDGDDVVPSNNEPESRSQPSSGGGTGQAHGDAPPEEDRRRARRGRAAAPAVDADADMKRLDDFWRLEIIRPSKEEITRRALFEVRKQQFREMCEDGPPIKALTFLQTKVSEVVKHDDPEEAKAFRSLLSAHLLSAFPRSSPEESTSATRPASEAGPSSTREDSPPPRKRSRSNSPTAGTVSVVRWEQDPCEAEGGAPSPERFRQRTEMFERLMTFINEDARQPDKNIIEMISDEGLGI